MKGNCPSCNAVVTISADAPANPQVSSQPPTKQIEEEIIDLEPIDDLEGFDQNYADPVSMSPTIQPAPQQYLQQQPFQQPLQQQSANPNLSRCRVCGGAVATNALTCPHCGENDPVTIWVKCRNCHGPLETTASKRVYLRCPHCRIQNPTFSEFELREDRKSRIVLFFVSMLVMAMLLAFLFSLSILANGGKLPKFLRYYF